MALIPKLAPPVAPFDLGAPPAELPQGSSNLPAFDQLSETATREVDVMQEPNAQWLEQISAYTPDEQALMLAWWSRAWNRPSPYLPRNAPVLTLPGLLMHIEGAGKGEQRSQRSQDKEQREQRASSYIEWTAECTLRLQWIEGKRAEWNRRVEQAKAARAQWDAYVTEARNDYKAAKATEPPVRPTSSV